LLAGIDAIVRPFEPKDTEGVYHLYVIRVESGDRSDLQKFLSEHDVQTGIHYPTPIHRTPAFSRFKAQHCPVAEKYSSEILSLPMHPELTREQVEYVSLLIGKYVEVSKSEMMVR
jgi:dTDP-4-amino-4,6-dideoxygalactose transaminase